MNTAREFRCQQSIHHAMTVDPALPFERIGYNMYPEMCLAARSVARMTLMQMRFVDNIEAFGTESFAQFLRDVIFCGHDLRNIVSYSYRSMAVSIADHGRRDV